MVKVHTQVMSVRACVIAWRRGGGLRGRGGVLLLVVAVLLAMRLRIPVEISSTHHLPGHVPSDVSHSLADFSNQPDIVSWRIEEDHNNYTTWRYSVWFSCGDRCSGHAQVLAHDEHAASPLHGHAARLQHVTIARRSCSSLPLLPWPQFCDDLEMTAKVSGSVEEGAHLQQEWRTGCSPMGWLSGACVRWLRAHRDLRLERLQAMSHRVPA